MLLFLGSSDGSFAPGVFASGVWRLFENLNWTVGAGGNAFHKQQLDTDVDDFSVSAITPRLFAEFRGWPTNVPTRTGISYDFRRDWLGGDGFSSSHSFNMSLAVRPERELELGSRIIVVVKDFDDDGVEPARTSRDALRSGAQLEGSYDFGPRSPRVAGAYRYLRGFADGDDFDTEAHRVGASISQAVRLGDLVPRLRVVLVRLSGAYEHVDHVHFRGSPQREQDNYEIGFDVTGALSRNLFADIFYSYERNDSNRPEFDTNRNIVGFGITYRF